MAAGTGVKFFKDTFGGHLDWLDIDTAAGNKAAQFLAAGVEIGELFAVGHRFIERGLLHFIIGDWNSKSASEGQQFLLIELFLLV